MLVCVCTRKTSWHKREINDSTDWHKCKWWLPKTVFRCNFLIYFCAERTERTESLAMDEIESIVSEVVFLLWWWMACENINCCCLLCTFWRSFHFSNKHKWVYKWYLLINCKRMFIEMRNHWNSRVCILLFALFFSLVTFSFRYPECLWTWTMTNGTHYSMFVHAFMSDFGLH